MHYKETFNLPLFCQKFERYMRRNNLAEETIVGYGKDLKSFAQFLYVEYSGAILLEQIQRNDILDYLAYLQEEKLFKHSTVQRHLSTLKSFYRFLFNEMGFKDNIAAKIRHQAQYSPLPKVLTLEEMDKLLDTAKTFSNYFYVLFSILYYTGSRISAATMLKKKDIDFKENKIYFRKVKGGRDLYLPVNKSLVSILDDFIKNHPAKEFDYLFHSPQNASRPIDNQTVRNYLRKVAKQAGIDKRVTPHILRHTMATHLTTLGVDHRVIMEILGHVDPRATARYQHLNVEDLRDPLDLL